MFFIADHSWLQLVKSVLICCVCLRCLRVASYKAITQESVAVWAPLLGLNFGRRTGPYQMASTVHHHARPLYVPHCCTGAQLHTRQTRYMYALKAPTCPHDKTSSTYPFQSCKELSPQFCVVFLMHASSSVLGRSLVDCCDPCAFPLLLLGPVLGPVLAPVLGAVLGPVLGTTIRIERTGAKTEAKTGSQIWTQKWNHFRKIVRAFFRACGESLSAMELPMFCNFRLFSCSRASLHAFCDSQLKRSSQLLEKERAQA